jgi:hypothetical protein
VSLRESCIRENRTCSLGGGRRLARKRASSDPTPKKPPNEGVHPEEVVEGRGVAKGNADEIPAPRTQSRTSRASRGLEGVREAARRDRRLRFTALLLHITPSLLAESYYALQHHAAAGVDGVAWREYRGILHERVRELHRKIHAGAYRAQPSRRVYIPKADGRQRPLPHTSERLAFEIP